MKRIFLFIAISWLFVHCSTTTGESTNAEIEGGEYVEYNNPPAEGFNLENSDMLAILLADKSMQAMGGRQAWDNTRYISWNFFGRRDHLWDKSTGDIRIEIPSSEMTILMNINTKEGKVMKGGSQVTDSLKYFLEKGYEWWVNDSYWLVMPYKLKDSGVTLNYLREDTTMTGQRADVLQMTFDEVGVTPENIYEIWIDTDSKLVTQWAYYPDANAKDPGFVTPWAEYEKYGEILLSGSRGDYSLTNIKVLDQVPENIFEDFNAPMTALQ